MSKPSRRAAGAALLALAAAAVVYVVLVGADRDERRPLSQPQPAVSTVEGLGSFDGYEHSPTSGHATLDPAQCTELPASAADPLRHELQMTGTFDGQNGDGRATFTSTSPGYQNVGGTYADPQCRNRAKLTGTVHVEFGPLRCAGTGTYEKRNVTDYTMAFDGTCDKTTTEPVEKTRATIQFKGNQTPCPGGCGSDHPQGATSQIAGIFET